MNGFKNINGVGGMVLYPAEFDYQIEQAQAVSRAVLYLLRLFNKNTPKTPRSPAGSAQTLPEYTGHRAA